MRNKNNNSQGVALGSTRKPGAFIIFLAFRNSILYKHHFEIKISHAISLIVVHRLIVTYQFACSATSVKFSDIGVTMIQLGLRRV